MMKIRTLLLAALLAAAPALAAEQSGTALLFDTGQIDGVASGTALHYAHRRQAAEETELLPIEDGAISVSVFEEADSRRSQVRIVAGKRDRKLPVFPADRGNPVFVTFLESVLSSVAKATKGSPFYLRNRVKDALATGGTVTREDGLIRIAYRPFEKDENRDRLNGFAGLSLVFVLDEDTPGRFRELSAATDDGETYSETIVFESAGKSGE